MAVDRSVSVFSRCAHVHRPAVADFVIVGLEGEIVRILPTAPSGFYSSVITLCAGHCLLQK